MSKLFTSMILSLVFWFNLCSRIIWLGDLNYRVALSYRAAKALVEMHNRKDLLENDQARSSIRRMEQMENILPSHIQVFKQLRQVCRRWKTFKTKENSSMAVFLVLTTITCINPRSR
ncbi:hypothetical protein AHAS_Ahas13G0388400 [Arachis hypogaea]